MSKENGGPAFPQVDTVWNPDAEEREVRTVAEGVSVRDYFAAKVLQGFCANPAVFASDKLSGWALVNGTEDTLSNYAYYIAEAMLAARTKESA